MVLHELQAMTSYFYYVAYTALENIEVGNDPTWDEVVAVCPSQQYLCRKYKVCCRYAGQGTTDFAHFFSRQYYSKTGTSTSTCFVELSNATRLLFKYWYNFGMPRDAKLWGRMDSSRMNLNVIKRVWTLQTLYKPCVRKRDAVDSILRSILAEDVRGLLFFSSRLLGLSAHGLLMYAVHVEIHFPFQCQPCPAHWQGGREGGRGQESITTDVTINNKALKKKPRACYA